MINQRKSRGDRLSLEEANTLLALVRDEGGSPVGFSDGNGVYRAGGTLHARFKCVRGKLTGADLEPFSIVVGSGVVGTTPTKNISFRFNVKRRETTKTTAFYWMLVNGNNKVKSNSEGLFVPVSDWCPVLVRGSATADDVPVLNEPCGLEPNTGFLTKKMGGLICVGTGYQANVDGSAKNLYAVRPQPHQWWWATVNSKDTGANTYNVTTTTEPTITRDVVCKPVPANGGSAFTNGSVVKVEVNPFTGEYHITEKVGC